MPGEFSKPSLGLLGCKDTQPSSLITNDSRSVTARRAWVPNHSMSPPLQNPKILECSRNSPTIDRTWMFSERPAMPGQTEQMARTMRSTLTPAWLAR